MSEKDLSDSVALGKLGTTDTPTGVDYPDLSLNAWGASFARMIERMLLGLELSDNFRVFEVDGNADAVGVKAGRCTISSVVLSYAGADPAVDSLADNDTTYVWISDVGSAATVGSAIDGTGWPVGSHLKLAEVTMASGAITAILDRRFDHVFSVA